MIEQDNAAKLLRMAGQIVDFWRAYPPEAAVEGISSHIGKFWTARMRADLLAASAAEGAALDPLLRAAVEKLTPAST